MFGSVTPRRFSQVRQRSRGMSISSVYSHASDEEFDESAANERADDIFDAHTSSRPGSAYTASSGQASSDRDSVVSARKPSMIEYNINPFGSEPITIKQQNCWPRGIRSESNANIVFDRLGSIGGSPEMRNITSRLQDIDDLMATVQQPSTVRQSSGGRKDSVSYFPQPANSSPVARFSALPSEVVAASSRPPSMMAPPPRPPRARQRSNSKAKRLDVGAIAERLPTTLAEEEEPPESQKRRSAAMGFTEGSQFNNEPKVLLRLTDNTGIRRITSESEDQTQAREPLLTREQWEAEYLPKLMEEKRLKALEEQGIGADGNSVLKSARSTPVYTNSFAPQEPLSPRMSPGKRAANDEQRPGQLPSEGREAKRRSRSPVKSHRSSPHLSTAKLLSPPLRTSHLPQAEPLMTPRSQLRAEDGNNAPLASAFQEVLASARDRQADRFSQDSRARRTLSFSTQSGSVLTPLAAAEPAIEPLQPSPRSTRSQTSSSDGAPAPSVGSSTDSSEDQSRVASLLSERAARIDHRDSVSSEASSVATTMSTPTLSIRLNDSMTNLALGDVSTDLMQDDQSLMALYKSGDASFDVGGQSLYKLLGGDPAHREEADHTARKRMSRPASEKPKQTARMSRLGHARTSSDRTGEMTPRRAATHRPMLSDSYEQSPRSQAPCRMGVLGSLGGSPGKARGLVPSTPTTPIGLGIRNPDPVTPATFSSLLKKRVDLGATPEEGTMQPLVITPKRTNVKPSEPNFEGDDSTASLSLFQSRNHDGSFLMDEKLDEALLHSANMGTFSAKMLSPFKKMMKPTAVSEGSPSGQKQSPPQSTATKPLTRSPVLGLFADETQPLPGLPTATPSPGWNDEPLFDEVLSQVTRPGAAPTPSSISTAPSQALPGSRIPSGSSYLPGPRSAIPSRVPSGPSSTSSNLRAPASGPRPSLSRSASSADRLSVSQKVAESPVVSTPAKLRKKAPAVKEPSPGSIGSGGAVPPPRSATTPAGSLTDLAARFRGLKTRPSGTMDLKKTPAGPAPASANGPIPASASMVAAGLPFPPPAGLMPAPALKPAPGLPPPSPAASAAAIARVRTEASLRNHASMAALHSPKSRSPASLAPLEGGGSGLPKSRSAGTIPASSPAAATAKMASGPMYQAGSIPRVPVNVGARTGVGHGGKTAPADFDVAAQQQGGDYSRPGATIPDPQYRLTHMGTGIGMGRPSGGLPRPSMPLSVSAGAGQHSIPPPALFPTSTSASALVGPAPAMPLSSGSRLPVRGRPSGGAIPRAPGVPF